jgi:hypothetical protein
MKMNYIFILTVILALFTGCNNAAKTGSGNKKTGKEKDNKGSPVMEFESVYHDFGSIKQGEKVSYSFTFKNTGNADLIIKDAVPSCGCTVPKYDKKPISPGEEGSVEIVFDSHGYLGNQYKTVILKTNTPYGEKTLTFKANVKS